jgi:hypothetical protein
MSWRGSRVLMVLRLGWAEDWCRWYEFEVVATAWWQADFFLVYHFLNVVWSWRWESAFSLSPLLSNDPTPINLQSTKLGSVESSI